MLLVCWVITLWFHWGNDGIWFQGDFPRHALNAVFFLDVAKEGLADPIEYARHYYTRYPAITPQSYPPLFYLMLGSGFAVFGVSGLIGKFLVQGFALLLGAYTLVGFRRWISLDAGFVAGFVAGLVLLMPGIMQWSGAVMLNAPAMALGVASFFHLRCVLGQPDNGRDYKHFCAALIFAALSIATHPTVGVVIPIAASWLVLDRRWRLFLNFRVLAVVVSCILLCGTLYCLLFRLSPSQFSQSGVRMTRAASVVWPDFYFRAVPSLIGWWSLPGVLVGLVWTLMIPQFRKDTIRLVCCSRNYVCPVTEHLGKRRKVPAVGMSGGRLVHSTRIYRNDKNQGVWRVQAFGLGNPSFWIARLFKLLRFHHQRCTVQKRKWICQGCREHHQDRSR